MRDCCLLIEREARAVGGKKERKKETKAKTKKTTVTSGQAAQWSDRVYFHTNCQCGEEYNVRWLVEPGEIGGRV